MELTVLDLEREVRSLAWRGDLLVDHLDGLAVIELDGTMTRGCVSWSFPFDGVATLDGSDLAVLYTRTGTTGALVRGSSSVRQLHRSYYHAHVYVYPVALLLGPDGRDLLVHCPDAYDRLEIEDAETAERLTAREGESPDRFHSNLAASPDQRRFLSAGWYWHPYGEVYVFDVARALADPAHLDDGAATEPMPVRGEADTACWLDDDRIAVWTNDEEAFYEESEAEDETLGPESLGVWSLGEARWLSRSPAKEPLGTMIGLASGRLLALYDHPRLVDPSTGVVVAAWPEIRTGLEKGAIIGSSLGGMSRTPPVALDEPRRRVAIANGKRLFVLDDGAA